MPPGAAIADVSGAIIVLAALRSNPNLRSRAFRAVKTEEFRPRVALKTGLPGSYRHCEARS